MPTSSSGGNGIWARLPRKIDSSTPGAILQPQPPPCDRLVKRGSAAGGEEEERVMGRIVGDGKGRRWRGAQYFHSWPRLLRNGFI